MPRLPEVGWASSPTRGAPKRKCPSLFQNATPTKKKPPSPTLPLLLLSGLLQACTTTSIQTEYAFNALARAKHLDLGGDGYIIGIEKRSRTAIGNPAPSYNVRYQPLPGDAPITEVRNKRFHAVTNDTDALVVSHIASFFGQRQYPYNAYGEYRESDLGYEAGYHGLQAFQADLQNRLLAEQQGGEPYTHILLFAMGWNNTQHRAIWNCNQILRNMAEVAGEKEIPFRPLSIVLTWPSVWKPISDNWVERRLAGHVGSYFNKVNDADEIGYTYANWILNKQLAQVKTKAGDGKFPKVIAIGHSMGARILSRALFSQGHLKGEVEAGGTADLFIGIQGAFSVNRFLAGKGVEGAPYAGFKEIPTPIVLTTTRKDLATPVARFTSGASHVGSLFGLNIAKEHPDTFNVKGWPEAFPLALTNQQVTFVDCDSFLDGHEDFLDKEMAKLLWGIMGVDFLVAPGY